MASKNQYGLHIVFVLLSLVLQSCHDKHSMVLPKESKTVCPLLLTEEVDDLADYIKHIELIPIQQNLFIGCSQMLVGKDRLFILSGSAVFSISKEGNRVSNIGKIGRGPGEYLKIRHICFNSDESEIWCLDTYLNRVYRYCTSDGTFVGIIDPEILGESVDAIMPVLENRIGFYIPNPPNVGQYKQEHDCLRIYDIKGNKFSSAIPWMGFSVVSGFTRPVSISFGNKVALSIGLAPCFFLFEEGRLSECVNLDFGEKKPSMDLRYSNNPWDGVTELFQEDSYKLLSSVYYVKDALYFTVYGEKSSLWNFFINKDTSKGIRWQSGYVGGPPKGALASDAENLYFYLDDLQPRPSDLRPDPLVIQIQRSFREKIVPGMPYIVKVHYEVQ